MRFEEMSKERQKQYLEEHAAKPLIPARASSFTRRSDEQEIRRNAYISAIAAVRELQRSPQGPYEFGWINAIDAAVAEIEKKLEE